MNALLLQMLRNESLHHRPVLQCTVSMLAAALCPLFPGKEKSQYDLMGEQELKSILDVILICVQCGTKSRIADCEGDVDGDGSLGCPVPDCGGIMVEPETLNSLVWEDS